MHRTRFTWNVVLADETGATIETTYSAFWSPDKTESGDVAAACAAEANALRARAEQPRLVPISAALA
jgi:hypothetical protein